MRTRVGATAAIGALTLVLAGCGGDDDPGVGGTETEATPGATSTPEPTSSVDLDFEDDAEDPEATATPAEQDDDSIFASDEECLTATWRLDNDSWQDAVGNSFEQGGVTLESLGGTVLMDLRADGSLSSVYDRWTITMSIDGMDGGGTIERDGIDTGSWELSGDTVEISEESADSVVSTSFEVEGQVMEMDGIEGEASAIETFVYECDADVLVATTGEGTFSFTRD